MTTPPHDGPTATHEPHAFLVALVDTLGADFDVAAFLHTFVTGCVALLDMDSAGLLLADSLGALELAAYHGEPALLVGRFELACGAGPSIECHRTGQPVQAPTKSALVRQWPDLAATAQGAGITTLHAVPMRWRDKTIGVLTLLGSAHHGLRADTLTFAQSLTEAATIGLLNQRIIRAHEETSAQLQTALTSRIVIEQAKGILAGRLGITVVEAFALLRGHARANNLKLHAVAEDVVNGGTSIAAQEPAHGQQRLSGRA